jgi:hypothetical protein
VVDPVALHARSYRSSGVTVLCQVGYMCPSCRNEWTITPLTGIVVPGEFLRSAPLLRMTHEYCP